MREPVAGLPYGSPAYWDARYAGQAADDACDEWYGGAALEAVLGVARALCLRPGTPALEIGCGGSRLAERLAAEMQLAVTATDISPAAVGRCRRREGAAAAVTWAVADAAALPFPPASFSLVLDKGVCDALDCDDGADGTPTAAAALAEAARVLMPGGALILASCREPADRAPLLAGRFVTAGVLEVWAAVEAGRARAPCPEAYVYTLVPVSGAGALPGSV